jgi:transcriptional regulator with XRE-family HTH domain
MQRRGVDGVNTTTRLLRSAGRAIDDRLDEMALSQSDAAARSGLSTRTWSELRSGVDRNYTPKTIRLVEQALEWPRGHLKALMAGEAPPSGPVATPRLRQPETVEEAYAIVRSEVAGLDPDDAVIMLRRLARQLVAERKKRGAAG